MDLLTISRTAQTPGLPKRKIFFNLCVSIGADSADLVPFEKYARAAESLRKPSSAARALMAGVPNIERVDRVVQAIARANGMQLGTVQAIVDRVDARLVRNQAEAAA